MIFTFLIVYLIRHFGADYEVGGVHGFLGVCAAGVVFAFGGEGEIVGRVLVLFVFCSVGLHIFQQAFAFDLIAGNVTASRFYGYQYPGRERQK